ncbi:Alb1 protein [Pichia kluyveri]|uniref:Alb1 protein n=1 Tax=Pichia kluyveri TaxID=36015 RepID=A0AAV5R0F7_PICKL|nr:Alb1 protein [Pichia kluyveri]
MPSKNSVNKPKANITRQRKSHLLSKRRAIRSRQAVTTIQSSNGSLAIVPIKNGGGVVANTIMSNKKAKKVNRNIKYAERRVEEMSKGKKGNSNNNNNDDDGMDIDEINEKNKTIRESLWNLIENCKVNGLGLQVSKGNGTTLGSVPF